MFESPRTRRVHILSDFTSPRTASDMDGTLHTDLTGFEYMRDIKKVLYNHFNNLKSKVET